MEHALSLTLDARDAHTLQLHVGDRAVLAGLGRGSLEPSTADGSGDAVWREAIEWRGPTRDQGPVAVGTWADLLVVHTTHERRGRDADRRCPDPRLG